VKGYPEYRRNEIDQRDLLILDLFAALKLLKGCWGFNAPLSSSQLYSVYWHYSQAAQREQILHRPVDMQQFEGVFRFCTTANTVANNNQPF